MFSYELEFEAEAEDADGDRDGEADGRPCHSLNSPAFCFFLSFFIWLSSFRVTRVVVVGSELYKDTSERGAVDGRARDRYCQYDIRTEMTAAKFRSAEPGKAHAE